MAWWDNKMGACEARVCAFVGGELVRHRVLLWGVCMGLNMRKRKANDSGGCGAPCA